MKYYLIGIKGTGMSALALILSDLGYEVIGYDDSKITEFTEKKLIERSIKYSNETSNEIDENTIVVRSSAIRDEHPEIIKAKKLNLEIYDLFEMVGKITKQFETISVAGCHGKTTTTAMLTSILCPTIGANYYIGDGRGFANKENKLFIAEACEYRHHFMNYDSTVTVITNIDNDHLDYFKDLEDIKSTFQEFANTTKKQIIACGDDKNIRDLKFEKPVLYYGLNDDNDIIAKNINVTNDGMEFDCYINNEIYSRFNLSFFGEHNLLNALAAISVCYLYNVKTDKINEYLKNFKGAARRFAETIIGDNIIVDDYAHHSTEVLATIKMARQKYPNKKIVAIFEPHSFNRVVDLNKEFAEALNLADYSYVLPIYPSRDNPADYPGVTSDMILEQVANSELITNEEVNKLYNYTNTVFLFMSLKEIHEIKDELIKYLKNKINE